MLKKIFIFILAIVMVGIIFWVEKNVMRNYFDFELLQEQEFEILFPQDFNKSIQVLEDNREGEIAKIWRSEIKGTTYVVQVAQYNSIDWYYPNLAQDLTDSMILTFDKSEEVVQRPMDQIKSFGQYQDSVVLYNGSDNYKTQLLVVAIQEKGLVYIVSANFLNTGENNQKAKAFFDSFKVN